MWLFNAVQKVKKCGEILQKLNFGVSHFKYFITEIDKFGLGFVGEFLHFTVSVYFKIALLY